MVVPGLYLANEKVSSAVRSTRLTNGKA